MTEIDTIRLSQAAKDQLTKLKRLTGIENWNILCRWALMASLAEKDPPAPIGVPSDSNVEMSWKVFAGDYQEVILGLLRERMSQFGIPHSKSGINGFVRLNLHRGIAHLSALKGNCKMLISDE
jgi:DNA sulfur modification protein DndE